MYINRKRTFKRLDEKSKLWSVSSLDEVIKSIENVGKSIFQPSRESYKFYDVPNNIYDLLANWKEKAKASQEVSNNIDEVVDEFIGFPRTSRLDDHVSVNPIQWEKIKYETQGSFVLTKCPYKNDSTILVNAYFCFMACEYYNKDFKSDEKIIECSYKFKNKGV